MKNNPTNRVLVLPHSVNVSGVSDPMARAGGSLRGSLAGVGTIGRPLAGLIEGVGKRLWLAPLVLAAWMGGLGVGSVEAGSYGINFDAQYNPNFDPNDNYGGGVGPVGPITGVFGPGAANQANWNNLHAVQSVNAYITGNINATITDADLSNGIGLHVAFPQQYNFPPPDDIYHDQGGNDGGGPLDTNFQRLYNTGLRLGDVSWQIYTDVAPFPTYDLYIYNVGKSYTANGFSINGGTGPQGTGFVLGENYVKVTGMTGPLQLTVRDSINGFSIVGPDLLSTAYWSGTTSSVWNANVNNFSKNLAGTTPATLPLSAATEVVFNAVGASNFSSTTLGADTTIKTLTFGSNATAAVGIGGANTLTITPSSVKTGVTVNSGSATHTISTQVALGASQSWTVTDSTQALNATGVISGAFGLTKSGEGTLVFTADHTYSGGTTVAVGTLALDYTTPGSRLADVGVLTLAGGTVNLQNGASLHNEVVGSTIISDGLSGVTRSSGTSLLRLNAITSGLGVVNFGASNIADTNRTNTNGILGGWATVAGVDWAQNSTDGLNGEITAYAGYTDITAQGSTIVDNPLNNVRLLANGGSGNIALGAATTTINTLLQSNGTIAATVELAGNSLVSNGLMVGVTSQGLTIGGAVDDGTLATASAGGTLFLNNFSASHPLTINAVIADQTSASSVATVGRVVLAGTNTYTGATMVNSGALSVENDLGLGAVSGGTTVHRGAALELAASFGVTVGGEALSLNGMGVGNGGALRSVSGNNRWGGTITLGGASRINVDGGTLTLQTAVNALAGEGDILLGGSGDGSIFGKMVMTSGGVTKDGAGTWSLSGANTYTGSTTLSGGTLSVAATGNLGSSESKLVFDGGNLRIVGTSLVNFSTIGHVVSFQSGKTVGLNIFNSNLAFTANAVMDQGSGGFSKLGVGTVVMDQANTYTGVTTIAEGVLKAETINVISGASNLGNATSAVVLGGLTTRGTLSFTGLGANYTRGFEVREGGGKIEVAASIATLTISGGGITGVESDLTIAGSGTTTITGAVDLGGVSGSLTKQGGGILNVNGGLQRYKTLTTLAGAGTTNINVGLSAVGGTDVVAGANLSFGSVSQSLGSLTIDDGVTVTFSGGLASGSFGGGGKGVALVPEPGTMGLLLIGGLGFMGRRRAGSWIRG